MPEPVDPASPSALVGGKYRVIRVIGSGGMGAVYEGINEWTGRRVALKVLRPELLANEDAVRRFQQEAQATSRIAHPNIVDVLDLGLEPSNGSLFIVQEFLDGEDLRTHLGRRRSLPPLDALAIMIPVMDALTAAHANGVLHRDVKPENVFLARDPTGATQPKLIDFGISKVAAAHADGRPRNVTLVGTTLGTPEYMSPEQARGERSIDGRSDEWAVGAVLFELLTGRPPFVARNPQMRISAMLTEAAPRVELFAPRTPRTLADLIARALEREREQRFPSMQAMAEAARACETTLRTEAPDGPDAPTQIDLAMPFVDRRMATEIVDVAARAHEPLRHDLSLAKPAASRWRGAGRAALIVLATLVLGVALGLGAYHVLEQREAAARRPVATAPGAPTPAPPIAPVVPPVVRPLPLPPAPPAPSVVPSTSPPPARHNPTGSGRRGRRHRPPLLRPTTQNYPQ